MSHITLATLAEFRAWLGITTGDNAPLLQALRAATDHLERSTHRRYTPYYATRACSLLRHDRSECLLGADLLTLHACTDGDGQPVPLDDLLVLYGGILHHLNGHFTYEATPEAAIHVSGIWGAHPDWDNAWRNSADALTAAVDADTTTLALSAVEAADADLRVPRFSVGQLLRLDTEYLAVLAVDADANTLTVARGIHGSSAAAHALATPVMTYAPAAAIVQTCLRWAAWFYQQPLDNLPPPERTLPVRLRV